MSDMRYNIDNENAEDEWSAEVAGETVTGEVVERISKDDFVVLTKPGCQHNNVTRKPATEFEAQVTEVSCNECPIGWFEK